MGLKYYRASEKPDKVRKRISMSRYWFRDLKWVACRRARSPSRPRAPHHGAGPPLQGRLVAARGAARPPRHEALPDPHARPLPRPHALPQPLRRLQPAPRHAPLLRRPAPQYVSPPCSPAQSTYPTRARQPANRRSRRCRRAKARAPSAASTTPPSLSDSANDKYKSTHPHTPTHTHSQSGRGRAGGSLSASPADSELTFSEWLRARAWMRELLFLRWLRLPSELSVCVCLALTSM